MSEQESNDHEGDAQGHAVIPPALARRPIHQLVKQDELPETRHLAGALTGSISCSAKKRTADATQQHKSEIASRFHLFRIPSVRRAHSKEFTGTAGLILSLGQDRVRQVSKSIQLVAREG